MPPMDSQQSSFRPRSAPCSFGSLYAFYSQTPGGIPCCQLFSCHDDPSFPEGRAGAVHSPSCIPLELLACGGTSKLPAGKPPGSLQGGSWNNQCLPFSGAFQQRISKHTDPEANQAETGTAGRTTVGCERPQWDAEEPPRWDEEWPRTPRSSGQEVLDLCSTLGLTPTCLPLP